MSDKTTWQKKFEMRLVLTIDSDTPLDGIGTAEAMDLLNQWWADNAPIEIGNGVRLERFCATTPKALPKKVDPLASIERKIDRILWFHGLTKAVEDGGDGEVREAERGSEGEGL